MELISFKEAKAAGLKFYFTGRPCKRGHFSVRGVIDSSCVSCKRERVKTWRAENPDKNREIGRAYRKENKEKLNAQERARYAKNPKKHTDKVKRQYQKNGERIRAKRRAYHYEAYKNPEVRERAAKRTREWSVANNEKYRANLRNTKARRKNVPGKHSAEDISTIKKLQKNKCAYCKTKLGQKYHVDHILPVSKGGTNDRQNLQITCADCNLSKGARDPIFHAQSLGMLL